MRVAMSCSDDVREVARQHEVWTYIKACLRHLSALDCADEVRAEVSDRNLSNSTYQQQVCCIYVCPELVVVSPGIVI